MGDLGSTRPISRSFGFDRGTPIDRFYIERFLSDHSKDIGGRVLEVGAPTYSQQFGNDITRQDVLNVRHDRNSTIVADLSKPDALPADAFDCIVLTQTLQFVYDVESAIREVHRALRPGGVVLATVPGISSTGGGEWAASWFWSLTELSARRLFGGIFGTANVEAASYGNVYAATCFLHGLCVEEADRPSLELCDEAYPLIIAVRAMR
jgi:SAM-dependent methyltransferase